MSQALITKDNLEELKEQREKISKAHQKYKDELVFEEGEEYLPIELYMQPPKALNVVEKLISALKYADTVLVSVDDLKIIDDYIRSH
jgi:hypothetical protein